MSGRGLARRIDRGVARQAKAPYARYRRIQGPRNDDIIRRGKYEVCTSRFRLLGRRDSIPLVTNLQVPADSLGRRVFLYRRSEN